MSKKALTHLKKHCKTLKSAIDSAGKLAPPQHFTGDVYYDLLRSIAFQQLHASAATKIFDRFLLLFEEAYPYPDQILALEISDLRAVGFSNQKSNYIKNIAQFAVEKNLSLINWDKMDDREIIEFLCVIKGVGVWTVEMVLMSSLQRPDVFPLGDYGIQQAIIKLFGLGEIKGAALKKKMVEIAEPWKPYRTLASRYLWYWFDQNKS